MQKSSWCNSNEILQPEMKLCPDTFICFQDDYVMNIYVNAFPDYVNYSLLDIHMAKKPFTTV